MHNFFLDRKAFITLTANRIFWCHFFFSTFFGRSTNANSEEMLIDLPTPPANSSFLASGGIGFVNIDNRGPGVRVPLGLTGVFNNQRTVIRASILDLGFFEGNQRNQRYQRIYSYYAPSSCVDTEYPPNGRYVSNYHCSNGTDLLTSSSIELQYIVVRDVWISNNVGNVTLGAGYRLRSPKSAYGILSFLWHQSYRGNGGVQLIISHDIVGFGLLWGYDLRRLF